MRNIFITALLLLSSINCFALTYEELSTIEKLKSWGVIEKTRLFEEHYRPMRTIDIFSLNIKSIALLDDKIEKEIYYLEDGFYSQFEYLNNEIKLLKSKNKQLIEDKFELKRDSNLKDIGLLFISLFALVKSFSK